MINLIPPQYVSHRAAEARLRSARAKLETIAARKGMVAAMAEVMQDRAAASDACTEDDLLAVGFTPEEIALHAPAARRAAQRSARA